jgi:acetyltransferase-like isoleucine patch superfamily enzyme
MSFYIHPSCKIHPTARINVFEGCIDKDAVINEYAVLEGYRVEIGREAFIDRFATIGGGSCFDKSAFLIAGHWFHMGINSQVNTARGVTVGNEVGIGIDSKIFTHGAYIDSYGLGAPVQWEGVSIGNNVWLPNAWVNPGVQIGSNVVVAARSLVASDIPSGSLAAGTPAKVIKADAYPRIFADEERLELLVAIVGQLITRLADNGFNCSVNYNYHKGSIDLITEDGNTVFYLPEKTIFGSATKAAIVVKDQLRRNGIRFRFEISDGEWKKWSSGSCTAQQ